MSMSAFPLPLARIVVEYLTPTPQQMIKIEPGYGTLVSFQYPFLAENLSLLAKVCDVVEEYFQIKQSDLFSLRLSGLCLGSVAHVTYHYWERGTNPAMSNKDREGERGAVHWDMNLSIKVFALMNTGCQDKNVNKLWELFVLHGITPENKETIEYLKAADAPLPFDTAPGAMQLFGELPISEIWED